MNLHDFNRQNRFSISLHKRSSNEVYELMGPTSNIVKSATIQQQLENPLVEATIIIRYSPQIYKLIDIGDVIVYSENELNFNYETEYKRKHTFFIMETDYDEDMYQQIIECRNAGHFVMRNSFFLKIEDNETTSHFIERTATERGVPIDHIEPTTYKNKGKVFNKTSLFEAWYSVMQNNILQEDRLYHIRFSDIGLIFELLPNRESMWIFEAKENFANILNPRRKLSILHPDFTNIATAIRPEEQGTLTSLFGTGDSVVAKRENPDSVALYGEFPTEVDVTSYGGDEEEIGDKLQELVNNGYPVDSVDFRTYAINSLKPTDRIIIHYPNFGSLGIYFLETMTTVIRDTKFWHDIHAIKRTNLQPDLIAQLEASGPAEAGGLAALVSGSSDE